MQPAREYGNRTPVGVVGGICDELIVGSEGETLVDREGVVSLKDAFGGIIELAVTDQQADAARCQEIAVGAGQAIDRAADADRIGWATPIAALNGQAAQTGCGRCR